MDKHERAIPLGYEPRRDTPSAEAWKAAGRAFVTGLAIGAISFVIAEALVPQQVASAGHHDVLLAIRIGFIYTPVVGIWLGWLQRSWQRAMIGAMVGVLIGMAYMWLCAGRNFLAIMVGFPCLLGGILAAAAGSNRSEWRKDLPARFGKGVLAGLVLGFVYALILNVIAAMTISLYATPAQFTKTYIAMMWRSGPVALGIASAIFFVLIRWAVGLTRVAIVGLPENNMPE